jgi:hypothetical protein
MYNRFSIYPKGGIVMTICPIALYVGCKKSPTFLLLCPLSNLLGDQKVVSTTMVVEVEVEDSYQKYAEEELKKNKQEEAKNKYRRN